MDGNEEEFGFTALPQKVKEQKPEETPGFQFTPLISKEKQTTFLEPKEEIQPQRKPLFFESLGSFAGKILPFLGKSLENGLFPFRAAEREAKEQKERERLATLQYAPERPALRAMRPEEKEWQEKYGRAYEMITAPEQKKEISGVFKDPKVNYYADKIAQHLPWWLTGFASPSFVAVYEGLQQLPNIALAMKEKSEYDPLARRYFADLYSKDTPAWLRIATTLGEEGVRLLVSGLAAGKISENVFQKNLDNFLKRAEKVGYPKDYLDVVREAVNRYGTREGFRREIERMIDMSRTRIPSPLTRRIGIPETYKPPVEPRLPGRLPEPAARIATPGGIVMPSETPDAARIRMLLREAEGLRPEEITPKGERVTIEINPTPEGGIRVDMPKPVPSAEFKPPKRMEAKKPIKFKDNVLQAIYEEGGIKPNKDYPRSSLKKLLPPQLIKKEDDPLAKAMDEMAASLSNTFPTWIEVDTDLEQMLISRKRPAPERMKEEEFVKMRAEEFEKTKPKTAREALEWTERAVEEPEELFKITPELEEIERLLKTGKLKGKELTPKQKKLLKEKEAYEFAPAREPKPLPEVEIEKEAPKVKVKLVDVTLKSPTGEPHYLGQIPVEKYLERVKKYAKSQKMEKNLVISKEYEGRWRDYLPAKEQEKFMKEMIRDAKKYPKETWKKWELYSGYPITKEVQEAIRRIQNRLKTKKMVKLDKLKEELQKTDKGKVEWLYIESELNLKDKRKPSFKKTYAAAKRALVDTSGNIKKQLLKNMGERGKEAVIEHDLIAGAEGKAEAMADKAEKAIYKGLSKNEEHLLNRAIQSRRTIAISKYKPEVKHPLGLTAEEHKEFMKDIPEEVNKRADLYFKEMEKVLDDLKAEGLIDEGAYKNLKSKGDYSPRKFIQYIDPEISYSISGRTITTPSSGIKALDEGSYNTMETNSRLLLRNVISRTQGRIFRNRANKAAYKIAKESPDNGIFEIAKVIKKTKAGKLVYQKAPGGHTKIKAMIDGQAKEMIMPDKYAKEWVTRDPLITQQMANIIGWLSGSKILKAMATGLNPGFAITNFPRDIAHVWIVTSEYSSFLPKFAFQMLNDLRQTKKDAFLRRGSFNDYVDEGGMMTFLTTQGRPIKTRVKAIKALQQYLGYSGETSEIWTRLALRNRALKKGKSPKEATWIARNYLDFYQGGSVMKAIDSGIPYINAGMQGTRGIFRAAADNPTDTLWKFAQLGALASGLFLSAYFLGKECYDRIRDRDKVNNFCIPTPFSFTDKNGNKRWLYFKIAKDQGQRIVCTIFENLIKKAMGEKINGDQVAQSIQEFIPIIPSENLPPSLDAMFGYMANRDLWTREDIWKGDKIKPREEYTSYTHPALVKAGKLTGASPERLKFSLSQVFTRGNIYTSLVGGGLSLAIKDQPEKDKRKIKAEIITRLPIIKRLASLTPPYSEKELKRAEKAKTEEATRRYKQRRELGEMANEYYRKLKDEKQKDTALLNQMKTFIKAQPKEDRERLRRWVNNYGRIYDIPDRAWWLDVADMPPETRATVFWTKYLESNQEERKELVAIAKKIPGFVSDRFKKRFNILKTKWKKENK